MIFSGTIKPSVIGLALFCLVPGIVQSQDCTSSSTPCGDIDGDGIWATVDDVAGLIDYLIGGPAPVDSGCANVDGRLGLTVGDLVRLLDVMVWNFNQFPHCNAGLVYSYLPTPEDTIFMPSMTDIPGTTDRVELPIFISYFDRNSFEAVYLPFLPLGQGSNASFVAVDSVSTGGLIYNIKPDTVLALDLQQNRINSPVGRVLSGTISYNRVSTGVGQIVPEIVNEFDHKRMALAKLDSADGFGGDLYIPTIKTYNADPCCLGGGGNVDCDPNSIVDIADLTMLIDHLFIEFPSLCCRSEANVDVDTDVTIDIADLTMLIDHLFISFQPIQSCQVPYLDD